MTQAFSRVRFVMVNPSHPGNVGSAARAIKTMGFSELVLVEPKFPDVTSQPEAVALASGALDVLENARIYPVAGSRAGPVTLAFALTARVRDLGPRPATSARRPTWPAPTWPRRPRAWPPIVLGTERAGLTNAQIALCHRICHIPANPEYSSLNVAQALQLAAWELRYALLVDEGAALLPASTAQEPSRGAEPASSEAVQAFLAHWEEALIGVQFLVPGAPQEADAADAPVFAPGPDPRRSGHDARRCTAMLATAKRNGGAKK